MSKKSSMPKMDLNNFLHKTDKAIANNIFVKITLSKKDNKLSNLNNIYIRLINIKNIENLSFQYRYQTKDEVKNYSIKEYKELLQERTNLGESVEVIEVPKTINSSKKIIKYKRNVINVRKQENLALSGAMASIPGVDFDNTISTDFNPIQIPQEKKQPINDIENHTLFSYAKEKASPKVEESKEILGKIISSVAKNNFFIELNIPIVIDF